VPTPDALDLSGLDVDDAVMAELLSVDAEAWRDELPLIEAHYDHLGERVPAELRDELAALEKRLSD
jgi:phosphoenolpyruvate carboxykinase (GTP)